MAFLGLNIHNPAFLPGTEAYDARILAATTTAQHPEWVPTELDLCIVDTDKGFGTPESPAAYLRFKYHYSRSALRAPVTADSYDSAPRNMAPKERHCLLPRIADTLRVYDLMTVQAASWGISIVTDRDSSRAQAASVSGLPNFTGKRPVLLGPHGLLPLFTIDTNEGLRPPTLHEVDLTLSQFARQAKIWGRAPTLIMTVSAAAVIPTSWPALRMTGIGKAGLPEVDAPSEPRISGLRDSFKEFPLLTNCALSKRHEVACDAAHLVPSSVGSAAYQDAQLALVRACRNAAQVSQGAATTAVDFGNTAEVQDRGFIEDLCLCDVRLGHIAKKVADSHDIARACNGLFLEKSFHWTFDLRAWLFSPRGHAFHLAMACLGRIAPQVVELGGQRKTEGTVGEVYETTALDHLERAPALHSATLGTFFARFSVPTALNFIRLAVIKENRPSPRPLTPPPAGASAGERPSSSNPTLSTGAPHSTPGGPSSQQPSSDTSMPSERASGETADDSFGTDSSGRSRVSTIAGTVLTAATSTSNLGDGKGKVKFEEPSGAHASDSSSEEPEVGPESSPSAYEIAEEDVRELNEAARLCYLWVARCAGVYNEVS